MALIRKQMKKFWIIINHFCKILLMNNKSNDFYLCIGD
jgi:hypothetical protein